MKNKVKLVLAFLGLSFFFFGINYFNVINDDLMWNYGFCNNFAKGMTMYKDYNMVITPLYPLVVGTLMKLFGNNMLVFYIINSMIPASIMMLVLKMSKKAFIPTMLLLSFVSVPNYNLLCILFLFILLWLEREDKNDYIIGILLGLTFLTKSSVGVLLCLPTIFYLKKNFRKVFKRVVGFLLPNVLIFIWFYLNGSLYDYVNYCFLGLFDFAKGNTEVSFLIVITIFSVIYLIRQFIKYKDIEILYILCFQMIAYPIFNGFHVMYAGVPVLYYMISHLPKKLDNFYKDYSKLFALFLVCPIIGSIMVVFTHDFVYVDDTFKYRYVDRKFYEDAMLIDGHFKGNYDNVYFVMYSSYLNKYLLNLDIGKYDLLLKGNLGYKGEDRVIKEWKEKKDTYFVVYQDFEGGQASKKLYDYVISNCEYLGSKGKYKIYYQH